MQLKHMKSARSTQNWYGTAINPSRKLAKHYTVQLMWVPSHKGIEGNKTVDQLARLGFECLFIGPEPAYSISAETAKQAVKDWTQTIKNTGSP
jgi:ribonuclease HI